MKTMKNYIKVILVLVGFVITINYSYANLYQEYLIDGTIKELPDGVRFSIIKGDNTNADDTIQSTTSKSGHFRFNIRNLTLGKMYFIILDNSTFKLPNPRNNWIRIVIDSPITKIAGEVEKWPAVDIVGSDATVVYEKYHQVNEKFLNELNLLIQELPPAIKFKPLNEIQALIAYDDKLTSIKFNEASNRWKKFINNYVKINDNSPVIPLLIMKSQGLNLEEKLSLYETLPIKTKESFYGKQLNDYLAMEKLYGTVGLGKEIPDFNLITPIGKNIAIKELIKQNKLTLIDFWASWCSPCRAAIPYLKEVYNQFKNQGFSIVGVSSDKNAKAWKKALIDDGTPWNQGLSVDGKAGSIFKIQGIPSYILVDSEGKIIASNVVDMGKGIGTQGLTIRGEELVMTLEKLLGTK